MLDVINRYLHGFVAVPVILACKKKGLFELLEHQGELTREQIVESLWANGGHLQVALRMMQSLNWLERNEAGQYSLTNKADIHKEIPEEILDLYHLPIESYLMGQQSGLLKGWSDRSSQRWNVDDPMIADFLDGILVIPILLALHKHNLLVEDEHKPLFSQLSDPVREELYELFTSKGWARQKEGRFCLTDVGRFIVERVLITGTTASYTPILSRMTDVLFGDCQAVFRRDTLGHESHVDRTLNAVASGFKQEKYFADVEEIILSIFNRLPIEEQPKYVVDMGCGDGTLLERVYETIHSKSARGKVLQQYPLYAIGVDDNEASITATARTLADIPHLVLKGDIGDPEQMITSLKSHDIHDPENILHIRSFLDHDHPFIPPQNLDKVQTRSLLPYQGVYVAPSGEQIPPHIMVQSLVEHLDRWSKVVTKHGLIILEVHCLEPNVVNRFLDKSENLHFDAIHGFSMKHLVEADVFLMAAAEVGLFPKVEFASRYPKTFHFTRITLNCFEKRPYRIRHPHLSDLDALVNLEAKCWTEQIRASADEIRQRIERYPFGHCVLEMDSIVVGVIYSQRISSAKQLLNTNYRKVSSLHTKQGPIIQLLAINILPEMQDRGMGDRLREFMLQLCTLKGGIERVVGVTRCKNYVQHADIAIEEYITQHNELGQLLDPILRFHQQGGATIKGIIPNYRPEDVDNLGNGVLIEYDLRERQEQPTDSAVKVKPELKLPSISVKAHSEDGIAIVGMACRFPGAKDYHQFWDNLEKGINSITEVPSNRWNLENFYSANPESPNKSISKWGGFIEDADKFEPMFFGISPREAMLLDPQQRLVLELSWSCLEDSGYSPAELSGTNVGVFVGVCNFDYKELLEKSQNNIEGHASTGTYTSIIPNRISYFFNFHGPSVPVDTACSSSLVAIHQAINALKENECAMALVGGVNVLCTPTYYISFSKLGMLSPQGQCKTFDAKADGYVRGEGAGVILLKPLKNAIKDKDYIYGVIRGSAVNHGGAARTLTSPNAYAQSQVIRSAYTKANIPPNTVSYIEAHGTGTPLGDPIEINGLKRAFTQLYQQYGIPTANEPYCGLGTVKTNIGHLESAAGIAGIIKVLLAMKHKKLPKITNYQDLNPRIKLDGSPFYIVEQTQDWQQLRTKEGDIIPRRAGVSSFGFGGVNAHVVLEEAPALESRSAEVERSHHLLTLSAKCEKGLLELAQRYEDFLATNSELSLADVCFTANVGRSHFEYRLALVAESTLQLCSQLSAFGSGRADLDLLSGQVTNRMRPKIAFLFTGQGSQYIGMGRQLYDTQPTFRKTLDLANEILRPYLEKPLLCVLYPQPGETSPLDETAYTQPALFAIEYALFELWKSWGIKPDAVMGHSVGEYVAACVAGVFSLEDSLKLIAARGRLMQALPQNGEMVALLASEAKVAPVIQPYLHEVAIAALNGPESVVISGKRETVRLVVPQLEAIGIKATLLQVSHAFHSPLMEPMLEEFARVAREVTYSPPQIDLIANVTGELAEAEVATVQYWCQHVRQPVRFALGMEALTRAGYEVFVECGPKPTLLGMGRKCLPEEVGRWLPSLRLGQEDWQQILQSLAQLYVEGVQVDWSGFEQDYERRKVALPTYPFQRQGYWIETAQKPSIQNQQSKMQDAVNPLLGQTINLGIKGVQINGEKLSALSDKPHVGISAQTTRRDRIGSTMRSLFSDLLQLAPQKVNVHTPFLDMGADSIILVNAVRSLENTYGIKIAIRQFFEEFTTIDALTNYIDQNLDGSWGDLEAPQPEVQPQQPDQPTATVPSPQPIIHTETANRGTAPGSGVEEIMKQQLQVLSQIMSQQLEVLRGTTLPQEPSLGATAQPTASTVHFPNQSQQISIGKSVSSTTDEDSSRATPQAVSPVPSSRVEKPTARKFNLNQQQHIEALIVRYTQRTQKSKQLAQAHRSVWADRRAFINFRREIKEMSYPIVGDRSVGSRFWDVDGNEYVDLTMGFGVHFFGYNPPFIAAAVQEQIAQGVHIGPQSKIAGEVAQLICELTGMERVTFSNTGTEAVMTAVRLARATTGRAKIAMFGSSYHGHFDGVLAVASAAENGRRRSVPMAPGVLQSMVDDVMVLTYDAPQSLEFLRAHANELAAVLVEPVPSRQPNLQPKAFLQQLRHLTKEAGIALIFDECITGFRLHPGGAQAWFGIEADIVTYAKLVGGGMPIGIIAGKSIYMDKIDGGLWRYGDDSYPEVETTFFAGTFCKHPLAMSAARAVLKHLKMHGSALQEQVNQRTSRLAKTLNAYFEEEGLPIQVWYCGSVFRFALSGNFSYLYQPLEMDLLVHHLIEKGVYIWEGRSCFLSTAHSEEDIARVIQAVKDSVEELQKGGFFTKRPFALSEGEKVSGGSSVISPDPLLQQSQQLPLDLMLTPKNICNSLKPELARKVSLNEAQKQLGILAQMSEDGSVAYNVSISLELKGSFQLAAMRKAVQTVVNRHEALRTIISSQNDFQEILPSLTVDVALVDFSNGGDAYNGLRLRERELKMADWLKKESQEPLDLSNGPLFRFSILKLEEKLHLLVLTIHHIVIDGWSMGVILRELGAMYSAECQGMICDLNPPKQFREYIKWQNQLCQMQDMKAHESYWLERLTLEPPVLDLPTDRIRPPIQTYNGSRETIKLDAQVTNDLKLFSQQQGCTLLMTLLSVYMTLIHRLTGQDDMIVGVPTSGRSLFGSERMVGYCAHLLPIRSELTDNPTFVEYLKQIRNVLLEASEHQDYPFAQLLNQLNLSSDISRSPLVTVSFNLEPPITLPEMSQLETSLFSLPISFTDRDIHWNVTEITGELLLECDYNTDLFDADTIGRWLNHFQTLLQAIVTDPEQHLRELPLLTAAERHQLLVQWNSTECEYPKDKCIHQLFEEQVTLTPDAVAVVNEGEQLTYRELNARANQLAHYLLSLGVGPEVLVGICVERSLWMVVGLLGILKAGGAYVPLDPAYPSDRLAYMLSDSQVSVLLTQGHLVDSLPNSGAKAICLDTEWNALSTQSKDNPRTEVKSSNLAYAIYTSGSTGLPKGVEIAHQSVVNLTRAMKDVYGINSSENPMGTLRDRILQFSSLSFDAAVEEIFIGLSYGTTLVLRSEEMLSSYNVFLQKCQEWQLTVLALPTAYWHQLVSFLAATGESLPASVRLVIIGGEAVQREKLRLWQECVQQKRQDHQLRKPPLKLINTYGPTEATVEATVCNLSELVLEETQLQVPIGRPIGNVQIYILDRYLQPVPIGVPGELYIGGVSLARGYLNRSDLTAQKFITNPFQRAERLYKTGDQARYLPDGNIEFLGRIDNQVKIRGFRIELGEIEAVLVNHPQVQQAAVIVREDLLGDQRLVAYLVPQQVPPTFRELRHFLQQKLPKYMVPSAFVVLSSLPLTPNGKVDHRFLPAPNTEPTDLTSFVPPRDAVEQQLQRIWSEVLHHPAVGVGDNFFELGGHSLLAMRLMAIIEQQFGLNLPLATLFLCPTIEQLAPRIRSSTDSLPCSCLVAIQSGGDKRPFFCVPGVGGNVIYLYELARHLGLDQPFYGLQAKGLDGESEPFTKVEDLAAYYIEAIQTVQPSGPYLLGGHSFGGVVAFEMAQQLQKQGHEVALVAIIDAVAPIVGNKSSYVDVDDAADVTDFASFTEYMFSFNLEVSKESLASQSLEEQLHYLKEQLIRVNLFPPDAGITSVRGSVQVYKANLQAHRVYLPSLVLPTRIALLGAQEVDEVEDAALELLKRLKEPDLGWNEVCATVDIHVVPGNHMTMMQKPHVQVLAAQLQVALEQAQTHFAGL